MRQAPILRFVIMTHKTLKERAMNKTYPEIATRLRAVREGFTSDNQKEFAKRHNFNLSRWGNWEQGIRRIPVDEAERLCQVYGLTLDWIYRGRRDGLSENASKVL